MRRKSATLPKSSRLIRNWLGNEVGTNWVVAFAYAINAVITGKIFSAASLPIDLGITPLGQDLINSFTVISVFATSRLTQKYLPSSTNQLRRNLVVWVFAALLSSVSTPAIAGLIKGTFLLDEIWNLVLIGFMSPLIILMIITVVIAAYRELRSASLELAVTRHRLLTINAKVSAELSASRSRTQLEIAQALRPVLDEIQKRVEVNGKENKLDNESTMELIKSTVNTVIRPLSNSLSDSTVGFDSLSISVDEIRNEINRMSLSDRVLRTVNLRSAFLPTQLLLLLCVFEVSSIYVISGIDDVVNYGLPAALGSSLIVLFTQIGTTKMKLPFGLAFIIATSVNALASSTFILLSNRSQVSAPIAIGLAVGTGVLATTLSYFGLLVDRRFSVLHEAKSANLKINEAIRHARTEVIVERKRVARLLHGGVQAKLQSALLRARIAQELTPIVFEQVIEDINRARELLEIPESSVSISSLGQSIDNLIDFWDGICSIETNLTRELDELVSADSILSECIYEVLNEAISNAVKHDAATAVEINFSSLEYQTFWVEVRHELSGSSKIESLTNESGFGTRLYNELTTSWKLDRTESSLNLSAKFILVN